MLGLFNMGNMSYEIDRAATMETSLSELVGKALQIRNGSEKIKGLTMIG